VTVGPWQGMLHQFADACITAAWLVGPTCRKIFRADYGLGWMGGQIAYWPPILNLIGRPSFWLHLHGPGKSGKTADSLVIGSVIGIGTDRQLPTWKTTNAAFQETARLFNDSVLIIDELALLSPGGKDAYQRIKALTYMFGAGVETSRSRQSAFAVPPASAAAK
jgi:hypothetical protein